MNSKKFQRVTDGKRKKFIKRLEVSPGVVVEWENQIVNGIYDFYSKLYSKEEMTRSRIEGLEWGPIDQTVVAWLEKPFDEMEIRKAVFDYERDKAPGLNGFSMAVFQDCWEVVKQDLLGVFSEFRESGVINLSSNTTFICLIPKKANAVRIGDLRPISSVTSLYKILGKVLSKRLFHWGRLCRWRRGLL